MLRKDAIAEVGPNTQPDVSALLNIIFRVFFNLSAGIACWVPARLLWKNGELAGTTMVIVVAIINFHFAINTLLWPNDDIGNWYDGSGWCDYQVATWIPLETLNAAGVCAIMYHIANQVSLMRATALSLTEKRRKQIIQALIIFPIPVIELALYWLVVAQRYNITGIVGCQPIYDPSWVFLVFFQLPPAVYSVLAGWFAVLTWWRYRQIDQVSREAVWGSSNNSAQARSARTKRKLYFMALTIVAPYMPLQLVYLWYNISQGMPWTKQYNFSEVHGPHWNTIDYLPSTDTFFAPMYQNYIAVIEVIIFFLYFGRTKDAHDMYRRYLCLLGLGKIFPHLKKEWFPPESATNSNQSLSSSLWSRAKGAYAFSPNSTRNNSTAPRKSSTKTIVQSLAHINTNDDTQLLNIRLNSIDLEAARPIVNDHLSMASAVRDGTPQVPHRIPWLFRTTVAPQYPFRFPKVSLPSFRKKKPDSQIGDFEIMSADAAPRTPSMRDGTPASGHDDAVVNTRVWASNGRSGETTLADERNLRNSQLGKGVRVQRHISSCSELSPESGG